jgi:glycosyltransferase involved in cell wall biosynthesis
MRVLYLSYDGLTDGLGRSQVLPYILGLEALGHEFTIVSFEKPLRYAADHCAVEDLVIGKNIRWLPLMYTASPPILSTIYDVFRLRRMVQRLHREHTFELVHCRSYITSLVGLHMKRKRGIPFIFDMRAFYADERVDGGLWKLSNPLFRAVYSFFKKKEREFLEEADHTISLTAKGKDIIHSWHGLNGQPIPIEVIPCCADLNHFSASSINAQVRQALIVEYSILPDDLVITYLGSIGTWYMLPEMLDFFGQLLSQRPRSKFLFITHDDADAIMKEVAARGISEQSVLIRPASREQVPTFLSLANVALFFIQPVFSKSGSSPTKHGEMLGMGLPVIANAGVGDVDSIISSTGTGALVDDFTQASYQRAIDKIEALLDLPRQKMVNAAHQFYSLQIGVSRYDAVYRSCVEVKGFRQV